MSVFGVILVNIFLHLNWMRRDTPHLSVFSSNAGLCGPEYLRIRTLFTQCDLMVECSFGTKIDSLIKKMFNKSAKLVNKQLCHLSFLINFGWQTCHIREIISCDYRSWNQIIDMSKFHGMGKLWQVIQSCASLAVLLVLLHSYIELTRAAEWTWTITWFVTLFQTAFIAFNFAFIWLPEFECVSKDHH